MNNKEVARISDYITGDIMWEKVATDYLYIENTYNGNNVISIASTLTNTVTPGSYATSIEYSKNKSSWTTISLTAGNTETITMSEGERVYFRNDSGVFNTYQSSGQFITNISCSQSHNVGGNVGTLIDYRNVDSINYTGKTGCFMKLFSDNTSLVNSNMLRITTTQLPDRGLYGMFWGCTSMVSTPELYNITTIGKECYQSMFRSCTSLTTAPALPATTLAQNCYTFMFYGCTNLTTVPGLPAIYLEEECYRAMFRNCTSLVTGPFIYAKYYAVRSCMDMFRGCTSLNTLRVQAMNISATDCTSEWLNNVAQSGTFYSDGSAVFTYPSTSGIPQGWSEVVAADYFYIKNTYPGQNVLTINVNATQYPDPERHTTSVQYSKDAVNWTTLSLVTGSYAINMLEGERVYFRNDSGLFNYRNYMETSFVCSESCVAGGELKTLLNWRIYRTINLPAQCFYRLFYNNTKLITAPTLNYTDLNSGCYMEMFYGCSSLINVSNLPATTLPYQCYQYMFRGCSSLVYAPAISGTTLGSYCCLGMFNGCSSLVTAPTLSATTLATECYYGMFTNCTSLVNAPALPATRLVDGCYGSMFAGCTSLVDAPDISHASCIDRLADRKCCSSMYNRCYNLANVYAPSYNWDGTDNYDCFFTWVKNAGTNVSGTKYMYAWTRPRAGEDGLGDYTYVQIINNVE